MGLDEERRLLEYWEKNFRASPNSGPGAPIPFAGHDATFIRAAVASEPPHSAARFAAAAGASVRRKQLWSEFDHELHGGPRCRA